MWTESRSRSVTCRLLAQKHLEVIGWVVVGVEEDHVAGARDVEARAAGRGADQEHE